MEIAEGIHRIPRVVGANTYLIKRHDGITVVDTGLPGNAGRILQYVERIGSTPGDVKTIILTHADMDHSGSATRLKEETNAKVAIHEADAPRLSGEEESKTVKGMLRLFFHVLNAVARFNLLTADVPLKDSDIIDGLTVIHTPGHTDGSICLYLPSRALFVGDTLLTNDEQELSLPRKSMSIDMDLVAKSIRKISRLEYSLLLPGHGPPIKKKASTITKEFAAQFRVPDTRRLRT